MAKQSKKTNVSNSVAIAACSFEVRADGAIQLTPSGVFGAKDGRPAGLAGWKIDDVIAQRILARLKAKQSRLVIDYEHQTLLSEENGKPAPAAGWFNGSDVEWRSGEGFFVVPEWTAAAKAHIEAKEYLYSSPVLVFNRNTGEVLDIRMSALTNDPAIDGMGELEAIASAKFSLTQEQEPPMDKLMELFGLKPNASQEEAITVLKAKLKKSPTWRGS
jgi:phage I-like protein